MKNIIKKEIVFFRKNIQKEIEIDFRQKNESKKKKTIKSSKKIHENKKMALSSVST